MKKENLERLYLKKKFRGTKNEFFYIFRGPITYLILK
jgi:hypothetical protein